MSKQYRLDDNKNYKKFIKDRDIALEHIYKNYQVDISNELNTFLMWMVDLIRSRVSRVAGNEHSVFFIPHILSDLDKEYNKRKPHVVMAITSTFAKMSQVTKAMSFAAQAEALARATGKTKRIKLATHNDNYLVNNFGDSIPGRIELALDRIKRRVWDKIQLSLVDGSDLKTCVDRVVATLPKQKKFKIQPRIKRLKEADKILDDTQNADIEDVDLLTGTIPDDLWDEIVSQYLRDEEIDRRGPEYLVSGEMGDADAIYEWEIEQQAADAFYSSVMQGDKDAADQSDVDLVWIAVLDDRTGESDAWRDGMLMSEIEAQIDEDGSDPFDNDILMPPIHERCAIAGSIITTDTGPKPIESINIGDMVLTHQGRFMPVERTSASTQTHLIKLTLENGTELTVTKEHPLFCNGRWVEARDLVEGAVLSVDTSAVGNDTSCKECEGC